jgi:hypothetical protein
MSDKLKGLRDIYDAIGEAGNSTIHISEAYVEAVRKKDKKVKLTLLPDLADIGWVRLYMLGFGPNFHSGALPDVDSTVLVLFPRGQQEQGICLAGGISGENGENGLAMSDDYEIVFQNKYGNAVKLLTNKVVINSADSIELGEGATKTLVDSGFFSLFMAHKHIDVLSGFTGPVDPVTTIITSDHQTTITKGK